MRRLRLDPPWVVAAVLAPMAAAGFAGGAQALAAEAPHAEDVPVHAAAPAAPAVPRPVVVERNGAPDRSGTWVRVTGGHGLARLRREACGGRQVEAVVPVAWRPTLTRVVADELLVRCASARGAGS